MITPDDFSPIIKQPKRDPLKIETSIIMNAIEEKSSVAGAISTKVMGIYQLLGLKINLPQFIKTVNFMFQDQENQLLT